MGRRFGDLGTLIPFVVAYISLLKMDPYGVLLAFGAALIISGLYYKTPVPVQPMKAIGAGGDHPGGTNDHNHARRRIRRRYRYRGDLVPARDHRRRQEGADLVSRPVAVGIVLGLGFGFMLEGIRMMAQGWLLGGAALLVTLLLLSNRTIPVMFLLLVIGALVAVVQNPPLLDELATISIVFRAPSFALGGMTWQELMIGTLFLALPQVPLTLGNAIIAITEETTAWFPDRQVTEKKIAVSTGIMNLLGPIVVRCRCATAPAAWRVTCASARGRAVRR